MYWRRPTERYNGDRVQTDFMAPDLTVERSDKRPNEVWIFFDQIRDVNNLNPAEEEETAWECYVDGNLAGMAVVDDHFPSYGAYVSRIAVDESYRRIGVATKLMETILDQYSRVKCEVHKNNTPSLKLMESVGIEDVGMGRYDELVQFDSDPD